jgi:hypothetical protein
MLESFSGLYEVNNDRSYKIGRRTVAMSSAFLLDWLPLVIRGIGRVEVLQH